MAENAQSIAITLVVMATLLLIGVYVNSVITPVALNAITYTTTTTTNETIVVLNETAATYALAEAGEVEWRTGNDLTCVAIFDDEADLLLGAANYTCDNDGVLSVAPPLVNETNWSVTYSYGRDSATHTEIRNVRSTFLSSTSLGVIVLIVLAASGIISAVVLLGRRG